MSQIYEGIRQALANLERLLHLDSPIQSTAREPAARADTMSPSRLSVPNTAFLPFQSHHSFSTVRGSDPTDAPTSHTPFVSEYGAILQAEDVRIRCRGVLDSRRPKRERNDWRRMSYAHQRGVLCLSQVLKGKRKGESRSSSQRDIIASC